jgi:AcrR family transcriptional regulator
VASSDKGLTMPRPANPTLRADILATALRLIEEKGVSAVTMREVAGALGYSATALYQHFESKEDLLLALKLQAGDLLTAAMEKARQEPTLLAQLQAMGAGYVRFGLENPTYYRLIFQDTSTEVIPTPEQMARMRQSWSVMRETLAAWFAEQQIHNINADEEANVLWAMVHGLVSLRLANRLECEAPEDMFRLYEVATARWFTGLLANYGGQLAEQKKPHARPQRKKTANRSRVRARRTSS